MTENEKQWRKWSDEEDEIMRTYYPIEGSKVCERLDGRSVQSVQHYAMTHKIYFQNKYNWTHWTDEEIEILKKYYPIEGSKCADRLPGHTKVAITGYAIREGIKTENYRHNTKWTEEEIKILKDNFGKIPNNELAELIPNRTEKAIVVRARQLQLTGPRGHYQKWTDEEIAILKEYYPKEGLKVAERLPNRTWRAVRQEAKELGVNTRRHFWTEEEDNILREHYPHEGSKTIQYLPNHTKGSMVLHAMKLGLKYEGKKQDKVSG